MKKASVYLFSLILFFNNYLLAYSTNPKDFINELVNDSISKLSDKNLNEDQKKGLIMSARHYVENSKRFKKGLKKIGE